MRVEEVANWANILSIIPGTYCAWGTWVLLHPSAPAIAAAPIVGEAVVTLTSVLISLFVTAGLFVGGAILNIWATHRRQAQQTGKENANALLPAPVAASTNVLVPQPSAAAVKFDAATFFQMAYQSPLTLTNGPGKPVFG